MAAMLARWRAMSPIRHALLLLPSSDADVFAQFFFIFDAAADDITLSLPPPLIRHYAIFICFIFRH
jgi:hypothetical protein